MWTNQFEIRGKGCHNNELFSTWKLLSRKDLKGLELVSLRSHPEIVFDEASPRVFPVDNLEK